MLIDEIIDTYSNNKNETCRGMRGIDKIGVEKFVTDLKSSQKFVLSEDVYLLARDSLIKKPIAAVALSEYAIPPFPLTWIEYEASFKGESNLDSVRPDDKFPKTKRIGFLVKSLDVGFLMVMCYSFKNPDVESTISLLSFLYNPDSDEGGKMTEALASMATDEDREYARNYSDADKYFDALSHDIPDLPKKEIEAATILEKKMVPIPCPYFLKFISEVQKRGGGLLVTAMQNAHMDWVGECGVSPAIFVLLSCKNAIEQAPCQDLSALNKARIARSKPPLQQFKTLQISLSQSEKTAYSKCTSDEEKNRTRLHWRRGHFKRRESGIFWWNPHLAGHKEMGMVEKNYTVTNRS